MIRDFIAIDFETANLYIGKAYDIESHALEM